MPAVACAGTGRTQLAGQDLTVEIQERHQAVQLWHIHHALVINIDVAGACQVAPLRYKVAVWGKNLDAVVLAVGHKHPAIGVHPDAVRDMKFTRRALAWCPPRVL